MTEGLNAQEVAKQLGLRKNGREWCGPCPLCGGTDRFHLADRGGVPRFGCRGCIDGQAPNLRRQRYGEVLRALGGPVHRDRQAERKQWEEDRAQAKKAAEKAAWIVNHSHWQRDHPYMVAKGFPRARAKRWRDFIVVPAFNTNQEILSVQLIDGDGGKKFLKHSRVRGARCQLGSRGDFSIVCEGLATALSVQAAVRDVLKSPVRLKVAFAASNIPNVADTDDVVVADHDRPDENGVKAGEHYARQSGVPWWQPPTAGMDANDYHQRYGLLSLAVALEPLLIR